MTLLLDKTGWEEKRFYENKNFYNGFRKIFPKTVGSIKFQFMELFHIRCHCEGSLLPVAIPFEKGGNPNENG